MPCKYLLPLCGLPFTLLMVPFEQKFLVLMHSSLSIFYFMASVFQFLVFFSCPSEYFPLLSCFTFHIWIYTPFGKDFFQYGVRQGSSFTTTPLTTQLSSCSILSILLYCATFFSETKCPLSGFLDSCFCSVICFVFDLIPHCLHNYSFMLNLALIRAGLPCLSFKTRIPQTGWLILKSSGGWAVQDQDANRFSIW